MATDSARSTAVRRQRGRRLVGPSDVQRADCPDACPTGRVARRIRRSRHPAVGRQAASARGDLRRVGDELRDSSRRSPKASSCACSATRPARRATTRSGSTSPRSTGTSGTPTCRRSGRGSTTAGACTARGIPTKGLWCNPTKLLIDPYAKAIDGVRRLDACVLRVRRRRSRQAQLGRQRPPRPSGGGERPVLRLGQRSLAAHGDARDGDLRGPRPRPHDASPGRARRSARHVLGGRPSSRDRPPRPARGHRHRADAGAPVHPRSPTAPARPAQLLGLQHDRLPRAPQRLLGTQRAQPGAGVQGDGQGAPRGRDRGDPGRRLQPHRRGQPPRADALDARDRQPGLLPPGRRQPARVPRLHRNRQQHERAPSARAAADHGQPALLAPRDARRRVPVRPGVGARPRAATRSTACRRSSTSSSRTR